MNDTELTFIKILLKSTPENLKRWYARASEQDIKNVVNLLDRYSDYIQELLIAEQIELEIQAMSVMLEAQAVIAAVR